MQEEDALAHAPERRGAEFVAGRLPLADAVGQAGAHVMQREIRERMERDLAQRSQIRFGGGKAVGVAEHAADARVGRDAGRNWEHCAEQCLAAQRRSAERLAIVLAGEEIAGHGRRVQAHEDGEVFDQGRDLAGVIARVAPRGDDHVRVVFRRGIGGATAIGPFIGEQLIGDAHLHVGGFAGKHQHGFVLRFPAEPGNGPVIAAGVKTSFDSQGALGGAEGSKIFRQGFLGRVLDKTFAEGGNGNAQRDVAILDLGGEIGLLQGAAGGGIHASGDGKQIVYAAVGSAVSIFDETRFHHGTGLGDEAGNGIGGAVKIGYADLRIGSRAAAADGRLRMTEKTTVAVEGRPQSRERLVGESAFHRDVVAEQDKSIHPEGDLVGGKAGNRMAGPGAGLRSGTRTGIDGGRSALGAHPADIDAQQQCRCHKTAGEHP